MRARLAQEYPDADSALVRENPFQLLVATILSAQTTDENVNKVTPALFARYPTPADLADADPAEVEQLVFATGFYRSKTKNLLGMARALEDDFGGEVPTELDDLVKLPGVGRKTGNVVRSVAFDLPGLPVDTHVGRLARRLKLTTETDPVKAELDLNALIPPEERGRFSLRMILHGRQVCFARKPNCGGCVLVDICPSADPAARQAHARCTASRRSADAARSAARTAPLHLLAREHAPGAVERARRTAQGTLGLVELGGDGGIVRVAVAIAHRDDPGGELLDLRAQGRELGEVGRRSHRCRLGGDEWGPSWRGHGLR